MSIRFKKAIHGSVAISAAALMAGGGLTASVMTASSAAAAGSSFTCTAATDFLEVDGQLYSAPEPTTASSTAPVFSAIGTAGPIYNAMGYDPKNNYLYAMTDDAVAQPSGYGGSDLLQIDPGTGAITDLGRPSGLPAAQLLSGGFDESGNFWVSDGYTIDEIDVNASPPTVVYSSGAFPYYLTDLTYAFGGFWGFNQGYLDKVDPISGNITQVIIPPSGSPFANFNGQAAWTYADGDLGFATTASPTSQWARITGLASGTPSVPSGPTNMTSVPAVKPGTTNDADGASCEPLQVASPMPDGTYNSAYDQTVSVSGGTSPYTVQLLAGSLPPGLSMATDGSGEITGTPTKAGTYTFTVSEMDSNGLYGTGTISLTIDPATIHVTVSGSQTYGGGSLAFTETNDAPSGVTLGDTNLTCAKAGGSLLSSLSAGSYTLDGASCSGVTGQGSNYKLSYAGASSGFTVNPASLTVTAADGTMTYGGTVPSVSAFYSGLENGDTAPATAPTCSTAATSSSPVGSYPSSCGAAADPNYTISYVPGSVTVNPAPLTITASSASMLFGGAVPAITAGYSGLVNGDTAPATPPVCSTAAKSSSPGGTYPSTCKGAADPNYTITYSPGTVTVGYTGKCINGKYLGPLVIGAGQAYCVVKGAVIEGGIVIKAGGALYMTGGSISGALSATGANAITMCNASMSGNLIVTGSTGPLSIGTCGANSINGLVSITNNTGGLTYQNNAVKGSLTITNNTGGFGTLSGNTTTGTVVIKNNS